MPLKNTMGNSSAIFMTGSTGYLGCHLLRNLVKNGYRIYCLKRASSSLERVSDIASKVTWVDLETTNFSNFFSTHQIEFVLHCATDYGRKQVDPSGTIEANLILPLKLLHSAAENNVKVFINTDTILDKGVSNYSLSKKQFVDWLESYSDRIVGINVALEHFYGPGDDRSKFVTYIIQSLLSDVESVQLTEGWQKRDFIYIDDVIRAFMVLIEHAPLFEKRCYRFEVGTAHPVAIREFVALAKLLSGNQNTYLNFGAIPYRNNEVMASDVDISGLGALGWKPEVSLEVGLKKTIKIERERL